jgi:endo-1,4-beta-D-glucanase Y
VKPLWIGVLVVSVGVAAVLALAVTRDGGTPAGDDESTPLAARSTALDSQTFLDTYVEDDGRVVRLDQGGDTVSEGQAYGMLIALDAGDAERFDAMWSWTRSNLGRDDGLISWRWQDGQVVDPSSASDADLDMARALLLAAEAFGEPQYTEDGVALGEAILEHETVPVPDGLLLVAGQWATEAPYSFNPSYVSPVATTLLGEVTGDPRWAELERGSRTAVQALMANGELPPNWAEASEDGAVRPAPSPDGSGVAYGYDAARTLLRHAEACAPEDRELAVAGAAVVARGGSDPVAVYDLAGSPQSDVASPLSTMAQAAGFAAAGDPERALAAIELASRQQQQAPTYYGDAWTVLAPALLTNPDLGGCPPLEEAR